ncbi:hypothetical protein D3C87_2166340 [compost metagenome]
MVVHHVKVDDVGAGGDDIAHFLAQAGEVGGQDAGCDAVLGHGRGPQWAWRKKDASFYAGRGRSA